MRLPSIRGGMTYEACYTRKNGSKASVVFSAGSHKKAIRMAATFFVDNNFSESRLFHVPITSDPFKSARLLWQHSDG